MNAGADPNTGEPSIKTKGTYFKTPLSVAAELDNRAVVSFLMAHGATLAPPLDPIYNPPPLTIAVMTGNLELVKRELSLHPNLNARQLAYENNPPGPTALYFAIDRDRLDIATDLLDAGASPNFYVIPNSTETTIDLAASRGNFAAINLLIAHGAKPNLQFDNAELSNIESVQMTRIMLKAGADINGQDSQGKTLLYRAAMSHQSQLIQFLLEKGADPSTENQ
jgi:ankyrin repeat protein